MPNAAMLKRIDALEAKHKIITGDTHSTVFGLFHPEYGHTKSIKRVDGEWIETKEPYTAAIPEKLESVLTRPKRFIILIGGRGSGKSQSVAQISVVDMHDQGLKTACFREFQNSIEDSVHSLIKNQANNLGLTGFDVNNNAIKHNNGGEAKFKGLARNPDSVKSMDGFKRFWVEEAQATSENSLKLLTPTMREEGGQIIFSANPASAEDPFSKRFIVPFLDQLERDGIYEDDLHLIIKINWRDNYWFPKELEQERQFDYKNLPRAMYDHIWEGAFNDSVENALVMSEWFDACIDAHIKLGFKPRGVKKVTHDPSDIGSDPKAIALRHGNVFLEVKERDDLDVNEGCEWATGYAVENNADQFEWDVGGMGTGLKRQVNEDLDGTKMDVFMFNGGQSVDNPDSLYIPSESDNVKEKTNSEMFRNLRAQCYASIKDRIYSTYRAVVHKEMKDPEELISFSSNIENLSKLRSELCRMPIKPNGSGLFELYTKDVMRTKFKLPSPNLADCVMMSERKHVKMSTVENIESLVVPTVNHW